MLNKKGENTMHQYRIEICEYNEMADSANPVPMLTRYADNHEDARVICQEFRSEKQENGNKKYQVKLYVLCYKMVSSQTYFDQFQA